MPRISGSLIISSRDLAIKEFYSHTKSTPKCAKHFGIRQSGVYYSLKKMGIDTALSRENKRFLNQKYTVDESYFEQINTRDKAYIFGLLLADGHVSKNKRQFSISLTDFILIDKIKERLQYSGKTTDVEPKINSKGYNIKAIRSLTVSNYKMTEDLIGHGMVLNKTFLLKMPIIDEFLFGDFLRGFFDGDGTIGFACQNDLGKAYASFISTDAFCHSIKEELNKRGIK